MGLQIRRGTNAERQSMSPAPASGELIYVTDYSTAGVSPLWIGDGSTTGGNPIVLNTGGAMADYNLITDTDSSGAAIKLNYDGDVHSIVTFTQGTNISITKESNGNIKIDSNASLGSINDVDITTPLSGQVLTFNGSDWVNASTLTTSLLSISSNIIISNETPGGIDPTVQIGSPTSRSSVRVYSDSRALESIGAGADAAESPSIYLFNSRGTISSPTAVQNGDVGGEIVVFGHDGNDYETLGGISFVTNGAVSAGVIPSKISLSVGNYISSPGAIKTVEFDSTGAFKIAALSAAPASPVTGAVYVANGTGWDPATKGGVVPYPVFYDGVAFHPFY